MGEFADRVRRVSLHPPSAPFLSNLTGTWITPAEATDPDYWVRHLRNTVRFSEGLATLLKDANPVLVEVGPGRTLCGLAGLQHAEPAAAVHSLPRFGEEIPDRAVLLQGYGELWTLGCKLDAAACTPDSNAAA